MKKNNSNNSLKKIWNKLHWTTKGILEGFIFGIIFLIILLILTIFNFLPTNWLIYWIYLTAILMLIGIIFQLIEIRLVKKKNRL